MTIASNTQQGLPHLQSKKQAAKFYGVTERTIDRWLLDGVLPADAKIVIGGSVRFRTDVLLAHIAAGDTPNDRGGA